VTAEQMREAGTSHLHRCLVCVGSTSFASTSARLRWVAKRRPDATTWFPALPGHPPGYCQPRWTFGPGYEPARARGDGVPIRDVNRSAGRGALPQAGRQPPRDVYRQRRIGTVPDLQRECRCRRWLDQSRSVSFHEDRRLASVVIRMVIIQAEPAGGCRDDCLRAVNKQRTGGSGLTLYRDLAVTLNGADDDGGEL